MIIGARAVLGSAFSTTKNGSKTHLIKSFHHIITAITNPIKVPITKPRIVSIKEILICLKISPVLKYVKKVIFC